MVAEPATKRFVRDLALPGLEMLGLNPARGAYRTEAADRLQLRQLLTTFAVAEGRAAPQSATLAGDEAALDASFRETALRSALREDPKLGGQLFEALATSDDALFRRHAATALAAELDAAILERVNDKRLKIPELLTIIVTQLGEPDTRDAPLSWLEANLDRLQSRFGGQSRSLIPSDFCSEDAARRVDRLFRPRMAKFGKGDLDLARPLAAIRQCAALKEARGAEVSAALAQVK